MHAVAREERRLVLRAEGGVVPALTRQRRHLVRCHGLGRFQATHVASAGQRREGLEEGHGLTRRCVAAHAILGLPANRRIFWPIRIGAQKAAAAAKLSLPRGCAGSTSPTYFTISGLPMARACSRASVSRVSSSALRIAAKPAAASAGSGRARPTSWATASVLRGATVVERSLGFKGHQESRHATMAVGRGSRVGLGCDHARAGGRGCTRRRGRRAVARWCATKDGDAAVVLLRMRRHGQR